MNAADAVPLLSVRGLEVEFQARRGTVLVIRGVSFDIDPGEALGIVGESGSGKSVSALAILGLLPRNVARVTGGSAVFEGVDLLNAAPETLRRIRGVKIAMIAQDPLSGLNPVMTVGRQITESLEVHLGIKGRAAKARALELLDLVGVSSPATRVDQYPHQLSGGMRQRAMIAMALSCSPRLLIADEPTTALDVTIQAQILELLARLQADLGMAVVIISHDLGVVARVTDRVAVMYAGRIVETGVTREVLADPAHPYTIGLLRSQPRLDRPRQGKLTPIGGEPPDLHGIGPGCAFAPRCPWRSATSETLLPDLLPLDPDVQRHGRHPHLVACHNRPTRAEAIAGQPAAGGRSGWPG